MVFTVLRVAGVIPDGNVLDPLVPAARFGVVGAIASVAFSGVVRLLYRGRRLAEISAVRFGVGGAVVAGVFVPAFMTAARLLWGDGFLPAPILLLNGLLAAAFGGFAAAGSLTLAQRTGGLLEGGRQGQLDRVEDADRLAAGEPAANPLKQRSRSSRS